MSKIDRYIFFEISKGSLLVFFIFLSISWILQFTRLISLTNLMQVDILTILYLSLFLIPNLITIIMPFAIMFGLIITFLKLHKDRELISLYSLGLSIKAISKSLIYFTLIILSLLIILNFYLSPEIYKNYKIKEYEIRNKVSFEKINISNFIKINNNTFLDFKNEGNNFKEVFIKFNEKNENLIYAKEADIEQNNDKFKFNLLNGFKITIIDKNKIEKLEFDNYTLEIKNDSFREYKNFDKNTFNIYEDIKNKRYTNVIYKITDSFLFIFIIIFFYLVNIKRYLLKLNYILIYVSFSSYLIIINQILKNSNFNIYIYIIFLLTLPLITFQFIYLKNKNV